MRLVYTLVAWLMHLNAVAAPAADYTSARSYIKPVITMPAFTKLGAATRMGNGTGIVVAPGFILTAAHVVPTDTDNRIIVVHNGEQIATPIKIDRSADLALLSANVGCPCATVNLTPVQVDSEVANIGFPMYLKYGVQFLTRGEVQGEVDGLVLSTVTTAPGGSGSGVFFLTPRGPELVGMTVAISSTDIGPGLFSVKQEIHWVMFSVPSKDIAQFLKGTSAHKSLKLSK